MLEIKNITKRFGNFSLTNIHLSINKGDYFILLGISGAGKSLLLEMIAGLMSPGSGKIYMEGEDITRKRIQERSVGLVFQDYAVFPHLTVFENIAYPLKSRKMGKEKIKNRVSELAQQMNISHLLKRSPGNLSGGELQRVALARTLALDPNVLLLDEPLSALDVQLRNDLRGLLRKLNQKGQTILHVTHDYEEAVALANRVAVIHDGEIIQQGGPKEIFQHPQSEFVAHFIGMKNFYPVEVFRENDQCFRGKINEQVSFYFLDGAGFKQGTILLRGEDVLVSKEKVASTALNHFQGTVKEILPTKIGVEIAIDIGNSIDVFSHISFRSLEEMDLVEGKNVWISFKASAVKFLGMDKNGNKPVSQ